MRARRALDERWTTRAARARRRETGLDRSVPRKCRPENALGVPRRRHAVAPHARRATTKRAASRASIALMVRAAAASWWRSRSPSRVSCVFRLSTSKFRPPAALVSYHDNELRRLITMHAPADVLGRGERRGVPERLLSDPRLSPSCPTRAVPRAGAAHRGGRDIRRGDRACPSRGHTRCAGMFRADAEYFTPRRRSSSSAPSRLASRFASPRARTRGWTRTRLWRLRVPAQPTKPKPKPARSHDLAPELAKLFLTSDNCAQPC